MIAWREAQIFHVSEPSDNALVVYRTLKLLAELGFDEVRQTLITTAVSELSTNIIRYGRRGTITLSVMETGGRRGLEVIAEDQGPGIEDIARALEERFSTGDGLGLGLPSVRRIMDEFVIDSEVKKGTRIVARKWLNFGDGET